MSINGSIKVSTEELLAKAGSVSQRIGEVKRSFQRMTNIVKGSRQYWQGEAGDIHRKTFSDKEEILQEILRRFAEHSNDLIEMANNYQGAETAIEEQFVLELPNDVIV